MKYCLVNMSYLDKKKEVQMRSSFVWLLGSGPIIILYCKNWKSAKINIDH